MLSFWNTCGYCGKKFMLSKTSSPDKGLCSHTCYVQDKDTRKPKIRRPPTVKASRAQERRTAREGGGRQVIASGALPGRKGDVRLPGWLVESKTTNGKSYRFTRAEWQTLCVDAAMVGRKPVFEINISGEEFCVISRSEFMQHVSQAS